MTKVWIAIVIIVLVFGTAVYLLFMREEPVSPDQDSMVTTETNTVTTSYENITERTISLREQNDSGESGSAVLIEKDGKVTVTLDMTGAVADVPQPAHIHAGSCPDVGAVSYPLTNVVNGKSETVLDTTFAKLDAKEPLAINVHKSVPETKVYVSCGNLGVTAPAASVAPAASATPTPIPSASPAASATVAPTSSPSPATSTE